MPKGIKLGGRQAGTPNKVTKDAREKFKWLLDSYSSEEMKSDFDALTPKEKLSFISDLAEFVIPKLSRQEVSGIDGEAIQIREEVVHVHSDVPLAESEDDIQE